MSRIEKVLRKLSELYEFNRKLKRYRLNGGAKQSLKEDTAPPRMTGGKDGHTETQEPLL